MLKIIPLPGVLLAIALGAAPWAHAAEPATWTVGNAHAARQVTLEASVEAVRQAMLSTQVPGAIVALSVKAGDKVRAGQELLRIDARAAQQQVVGSTAQLEAAQAQLRVATLDLERQKQLFQRQFISQGAMDKAQVSWDAAKAQVEALQAQSKAAVVQTGFYVISAPFAGVVSDVSVVMGDMAMPGRSLITVYAPAEMRLSAAVPQSLAPLAQSGEPVMFEIPGVTSGPLRAPHKELLPSADPQTRTLTLRIPLPAHLNGVVPGLSAQVHLRTQADGHSDRLWIPLRAVIHRSELRAVQVLDAEGKARLRQVRLGAVAGEQVEVLSGLRPGEKVLLPRTTERQP